MIDRLDPGTEAGVQVGERGDLSGVDFDEELATDGLERPLDLAPAFRATGLAVMELGAEHRESVEQLAGDHRGAVVQIGGLGHAATLDAGTQRRLEPHRVLAIAPPIAGEGP